MITLSSVIRNLCWGTPIAIVYLVVRLHNHDELTEYVNLGLAYMVTYENNAIDECYIKTKNNGQGSHDDMHQCLKEDLAIVETLLKQRYQK